MDPFPIEWDGSDDDDDDEDEEEILQVLIIIGIVHYHRLYMNKKPCRTSMLRGHAYVLEILNGHDDRCYDLFRMEKEVFVAFCEDLKQKTGLKNSRYVTAQEQVAIFLLTISHNERNRVVAERFQHSGETISRYFNRVLKKICRLGVQIITPPDFNVVHPHIRSSPKYYPFFKNCIGAIDGTHIDARVPLDQQIPYRGKKVETTQNIMCACDFDMCFTFVMAGWEGTANDSRVIMATATNPQHNFPIPREDKYYVLDSGYANMPGFLTPYRGERYHLREYHGPGNNPRKFEELFNYRHSSLRNVIERCFGVLKSRFPILKQMPPYPLKTQKYIPIACCTVHNFIRKFGQANRLFDLYGDFDMIVDEDDLAGSNSQNIAGSTSQTAIEIDITTGAHNHMAETRDMIADRLWQVRRANRR